MPETMAAVLIGRNEGARLERALASVAGLGRVIYVDSGSTDGSVTAAQAAGAEVVALDLSVPFTAARARNAGVDALRALGPLPDYIQFMDGDCELQPGWTDTARAFLSSHPEAAVACGRRRERFPEASVYNRLCDAEWDTPIGPARACGGDALIRSSALEAVGGYNPALIAGEEPEMCVRLRAAGWTIWRLDHEMTLHDAAITRLGQWWKRSKRAGHAFAEGAALHGAPPERHGVDATRRALFWGLALPVVTVLAGVTLSGWAWSLALAYPVQVLRLSRRFGPEQGLFLVLAKFPEALGALQFYTRRRTGGTARLIEYK